MHHYVVWLSHGSCWDIRPDQSDTRRSEHGCSYFVLVVEYQSDPSGLRDITAIISMQMDLHVLHLARTGRAGFQKGRYDVDVASQRHLLL